MSVISAKGYQKDAVANALEIFRYVESQLQQVSDAQSRRTICAFNGCVLLEAPTGAGKTLMAGLITETFARADHTHNAQVVWFWFTPFSNLVEQAKAALKKDFNGLRIRDLAGERVAHKASSGDVFVTTWQSVAANNAATRVLRKSGDTSLSLDEFIVQLRELGFRIGVVIDEAHHSFTKATEAVKFYRDIMSPEFTLLITATPDDADVSKFKTAAGLEKIHHIQVSRKDAVDVGLIKEAVKSIAYLVPDDQKVVTDLELTALSDGWRTHIAIKNQLAHEKIHFTPLMLVQIDSKGKAGEQAIEQTKQRLIELGVPEDAIAWYTADDPNDDLLVVAKDESKEVLIFKVAVALGFDAPRAFTLVSLRGTKSSDFGIQVVGRILRVHPRLQLRVAQQTLPELLRFGYVFLADSEAQGGLIGAADKINAIQTHLSDITPFTLVINIAGQSEVQVSHNGQISLFPSPYTPPVWQESTAEENSANSPTLPLTGSTIDMFGGFILPPSYRVEEKPAHYRQPIAGNRFYPLRDNVPTRFKTERIPLSHNLAETIVEYIRLDAEVLAAGLRKNIKITRQTTNIFDQSDTQKEKAHARLSTNEITKRAQRALCDPQFIDAKDLSRALLEKLRIEYNDVQGLDLNDSELAQHLNMILATYPKLIRNAIKRYLAEDIEVIETAELPKQIEAADSVNRAGLNSYGIMPSGLNKTEELFAKMLESDTSHSILWWHRNEPRKPYSVGIVLTDGQRYFPDFIVGVSKRTQGDGILLIEIKGGFISNSDDSLEKINAEHKIYGKPVMLALQDDGQFWLMRYNESTHRIEKDKPFRVEGMWQY